MLFISFFSASAAYFANVTAKSERLPKQIYCLPQLYGRLNLTAEQIVLRGIGRVHEYTKSTFWPRFSYFHLWTAALSQLSELGDHFAVCARNIVTKCVSGAGIVLCRATAGYRNIIGVLANRRTHKYDTATELRVFSSRLHHVQYHAGEVFPD